MPGQAFLVGVGQADLSGGSCSLTVFEAQSSGGKTQTVSAQGDSSRGHKQHVLCPCSTTGYIVHQGIQPVSAQGAGLLVYQQR